MANNSENVFLELEKVLNDKEKVTESLKIAVNEYVSVKNKYVVKSNHLRLKPGLIAEQLGLSKAPTEKQTQAYIDDALCGLVQDIRIAEENVKLIKREIELLNDKLELEHVKLNYKLLQ